MVDDGYMWRHDFVAIDPLLSVMFCPFQKYHSVLFDHNHCFFFFEKRDFLHHGYTSIVHGAEVCSDDFKVSLIQKIFE